MNDMVSCVDKSTPQQSIAEPSLATAQRHIELLTGSRDTPVHIRLLDDDKRRSERLPPCMLYGAVAEHWPQIKRAQECGYGVFIVVNEGGNTDQEITSIRAVFIDADDMPLRDDWEWHMQPDFIVQRDDTHWHTYWSVADLPVAEFKAAQRRLATRYGTDRSVSNPARIMRLAGTLHQKDADNPRLVTLSEPEAVGRARTVTEVMDGIPELPKFEKPHAPSAAAGSAIKPETLPVWLSWIDPTFADDQGTWVGIAKAIYYAQLPLTEDQEWEWWEDLVDNWCSGKLWRERTGDQQFTVSTYTDRDEVQHRLSDPPRRDGPIITLGTIYKLAREAGFAGPPCDPPDANEAFAGYKASLPAAGASSAQEGDGEVVHGEVQSPSMDVAKTLSDQERRAKRYRIYTEDDIASLPPIAMSIEGLLFAGASTYLLSGPLGSYKTFITGEMALALTSGAPAFGGLSVYDEPGPVIWFISEGVRTLMKSRWPALRRYRGISPDRKLPIYFIPAVPPVMQSEDIEFCKQQIRSIVRDEGGRKPRLVVFDTLARMLEGLSENDASSAALFTRLIDDTAAEFDCPVWTNAHTGKVDEQGTRGSSAFEANTENVYRLTSDPLDARTADNPRWAKIRPHRLKDAPDFIPIHLGGDRIIIDGINEGLALNLVSEREFRRVVKASKARADEEGDSYRQHIIDELRRVRAYGWAHSRSHRELARLLVGDPGNFERGANDDEYLRRVAQNETMLKNGCRTRGRQEKASLEGLFLQREWPPQPNAIVGGVSGRVMIRWCLPEDMERETSYGDDTRGDGIQ